MYCVTNAIDEMDVNLIHTVLTNVYWSEGIPLSLLEKALGNSLCFAVITESKQQVGFARMITDKATFAYLADVFILPEYRGLGLSKLLMQAIVEHHELQNLRRTVLATRDAHGLYEQFGFKALATPGTFMEIWQPNVYQNMRD
ncbi:GNAT family N-acetyltransferase [Marinomonas sp. 2405UD68-3]|uniref:GNAT family N-acetyltransferase n=1 Tax=Marinomonas sp. 2405UD68-3 TaxID=3391835 RepID=UPI0039C9327B